jgi:FlaA1/EpsC-like NDP-sugar epimerase
VYKHSNNVGGIPAPMLITVFEYMPIQDIAYKKINAMLSINDLEQKRLITAIQKLIKSKKKVVIWGTGNFSRSLIANTDISKANIIGFLDNDTSLHNKSFCGYKVYLPSFLSEFDGRF